jgi:hypothetical protein
MEFFFGAFTEEWERRKAALLHDMTLGRRRNGEDEDEYWRRMGGGAGSLAIAGSRKSRTGTQGLGGSGSTGRGARPMRARFTGIARGSQPAVVKIASYGGGVRLGAMLNYVSRAGDVEVEDDRGEHIQSRERLSSLRGEWEHLFQNREESRDIGMFSVTIEAVADRSVDDLHALVRETVSRGFGERRFAYGIDQADDGSVAVNGVVVLRSADGERLTGDTKAASIIQERYDTRSSVDAPSAVFTFAGYGNGVDYGTAKLRNLVETFDGSVRDERGTRIENDSMAGDLVQKDWRHELYSRKSRDVMHLIMSARAGTDVDAFRGAARDFLAGQFSGHRYVFALHDPTQDPKEEAEGGKRPHVHVHAIITMKSEFGERIETSPQVFRAWRSLMAEKAREHGIQMEMTDRRELATAPAFGRNQVRPISRQGRTEHVGTSDAAHSRYQAKRSEVPSTARARRSVDYTIMARQVWEDLAVSSGDRDVAGYASQQEKRIEAAVYRDQALIGGETAGANFGSKYRANMVWLEAIVSEADAVREMSRPEFEAYEKRVETALFKFERLITPEERADYEEVATAARDHVNVRREIVELDEERREVENRSDRVVGAGVEDAAQDDRDPTVAGREALDRVAEAQRSLQDAERRGEDPESRRNALQEAVESAARLAMNGNEVVRDGADDDVRAAMGRIERDATDALWEAAVAKHGEDIVERANDLLIKVDAAREQIDRAQAEGRSADVAEQDYSWALSQAAKLALAGNSYMREMVETDEDLRRAVETADRGENGKHVAKGADAGEDERRRDVDDETERGSDVRADPADLEISAGADHEQRRTERRERGPETAPQTGETNRTDPAQQHVPRLEELERKAREERERDRDDFER